MIFNEINEINEINKINKIGEIEIEIAPGVWVGDKHPVFMIAEAGINHQGELKIAKELVRMAKMIGADCVKFQKRTISRILTKEGLEKPYKNSNSFGDTYGEHKQRLELSYEDFIELKRYADEVGILMTASGWDEESVDFLESLGVPFFKMASADLTNFPLLEHTARKGKPIILSTGMASMEIVRVAYELVRKYNDRIILLQCTSTYPAEFRDINLNVIETYRREFPEVVVGYSGHERGIAISLAAVVKGARVVERHFTLDRTMKGGDHAASLEAMGLEKLIRDIKAYEVAAGDGVKRMILAEKACFDKLAKSIVSKERIQKGVKITRGMLTTKGPGTGISPMEMDKVVGGIAKVDIGEDEVIKREYVEYV
jgi:sialic acid synthase